MQPEGDGYIMRQRQTPKDQKSQNTSFAEAYALYEQYARQHLKSYDEVVGLHRRYLKPLSDRKLCTITRFELQMFHAEIGERAGKTAANRALELISCIYNRAIDWDLFAGQNPATRIKKFRLRSRERFLLPDEVGPLLRSIDVCQSRTVKDFLYMCLFTAARAGKVMSMRWQDVDLTNAVWRIIDDKNGDDYSVPLVPQAVELLQARKELTGLSPFVFPAERGKGHMQNPRKTWYNVLQRAGLPDLRIHDLRRSHASWQLRTGTPLAIIGKTLNHRDPRSTLIYARVDDGPVREAMTRALEAMLASKEAG